MDFAFKNHSDCRKQFLCVISPSCGIVRCILLAGLVQINPGGDIPETYYLSNLMEISKEEMERVVVGRASSHLITHHVDTPGTILRYSLKWHGCVKNANITREVLTMHAQVVWCCECAMFLCRWDFMSTDHDIGYGWYLKSRGGRGSVEVVSFIGRAERSPLLRGVYNSIPHTCADGQTPTNTTITHVHPCM